MTDLLLDITQNPTARRLIKTVGLPIPTPERLVRTKGPRVDRPLEERSVLCGGNGDLTETLGRFLAATGARPFVTDARTLATFEQCGEAFGRSPEKLDAETTAAENGSAKRELMHALVFDATGLSKPEDLRSLYEFFHPWIRRVERCGKILVCVRPVEHARNAAESSTRAAVEGFVRSAAKEIGKTGATANLLVVDEGAEDRIEGIARFLLTSDSAFVSAQPVRVTARAATSGPPQWVQPLAGRVALVTGAARGIGKATAQMLAAEGAHVVCLDRPADGDRLGDVARQVGGSALLMDVSTPEAPQAIARAIEQGHGGVDVVVHNAGVTRDKTLARMSPELWDMTIGINLTAVERITRELIAGPMRDGGRIISLSSVAGIGGNMGQTNYAASKAGIIGFTEHLAEQLAPRGITVNAVAPGFIETRMTAAIPFVIREAARRMSALGQGGLPEDVARTITFLSTPGASGLTGNVLRICGGALIGA